MLTSRGLGRVLGDLSTMGYDAEWGVVGADDAGAPHRRERIWILAYSAGERIDRGHGDYTEADCQARQRNYQLDRGGEVTGQHPIGQLANANMFGCLHGQAEERPTTGGIHAQRELEPSGEDVAYAGSNNAQGIVSSISYQEGRSGQVERQTGPCGDGLGWWSTEPGLGGVFNELANRLDLHGTPEPGSVPRVAKGIPKRADRLKAIGNGQVPAAAALAWTTLYERIQSRMT